MNASQRIEGCLRQAALHPLAFAEGRARQPALAGFEHPAAIVQALTARGLGGEARNAIVAAIVAEARGGQAQPWQALLVAAFAPLVARLARRAEPAQREDAEMEATVALLEEAGRAKAGDYTARSLRLAVERRVSVWCKRERRARAAECFDEEVHGAAEAHGSVERDQVAAAVMAVCERASVPELAPALLGAPTLAAWVARTLPGKSEGERRSEHRRLAAARTRVIRELRVRFARNAALAA